MQPNPITEKQVVFIVANYPANVHLCMSEGPNTVLVVFGDPAFGAKFLRVRSTDYPALKKAILDSEFFCGKTRLI